MIIINTNARSARIQVMIIINTNARSARIQVTIIRNANVEIVNARMKSLKP
jgi:hypothetical protein